MPKAIIHIDMDAFYASVEQRDNPDLRGKPVIVGGHSRRGVVLAASYEVRPFGVRSAMPMARALRLAPNAVVVPPRFTAYVEASEKVFAILETVTPLIEPLSLDEAFLDVTASTNLLGTPWEMASRVRKRIADELGLPASAGIAGVKFVAKIASDLAKPNGQREIPLEETVAFLSPLPIARLWGVGPKLEAQLHAMGVKTVADIAARELAWMEAKLGEAGRHLWHLSHGHDDRNVIPDRGAKSIGSEDTFEEDLEGFDVLRPTVHSQALRVARRLRKAGVKTRVVQLKVKFADFEMITRRCTLPEPSDDGQVLYHAAYALFARVPGGRKIRLTGVSAQDLVGEGDQMPLFESGPKRRDRLNAALDSIADKFGSKAVTTADLADDSESESDDEARRLVGGARFDRDPRDS